MKKIITLAIVAWVILSLMYIAGEPTHGTVLESILLGGASLTLALLLGRELYRRGLIDVEPSKYDDNDNW